MNRIALDTNFSINEKQFKLTDLTSLKNSKEKAVGCIEVFKGVYTASNRPGKQPYAWTQGACAAPNGYVYLVIEGYPNKTSSNSTCGLWRIVGNNAANTWAKGITTLRNSVDLGHGNGATYVKEMESTAPILVCNNRIGNLVHFLNKNGQEKSKGETSQPLHSLAWSEERQQFIAGVSGKSGFYVLNKNLSPVSGYINGYEEGYTNQGGDCTKDVVLFPRIKARDHSGLTVLENVIHVQDWSGKRLHKLVLPHIGDNECTLEIEDLFHIGNILYATFSDWNALYVYRINIFEEV
jgi:hypothetical protein